MRRAILAAAAAAATLVAGGGAQAEGDAAVGEQLYRRCAVCHTTAEGDRNKIGPNLFGVMGSTAGTRPTGFNYSPALKDSNVVWDDANMTKWLENPRALIARNRMGFPGLRDAKQRDDVIAFLKQATQ